MCTGSGPEGQGGCISSGRKPTNPCQLVEQRLCTHDDRTAAGAKPSATLNTSSNTSAYDPRNIPDVPRSRIVVAANINYSTSGNCEQLHCNHAHQMRHPAASVCDPRDPVIMEFASIVAFEAQAGPVPSCLIATDREDPSVRARARV